MTFINRVIQAKISAQLICFMTEKGEGEGKEEVRGGAAHMRPPAPATQDESLSP